MRLVAFITNSVPGVLGGIKFTVGFSSFISTNDEHIH